MAKVIKYRGQNIIVRNHWSENEGAAWAEACVHMYHNDVLSKLTFERVCNYDLRIEDPRRLAEAQSQAMASAEFGATSAAQNCIDRILGPQVPVNMTYRACKVHGTEGLFCVADFHDVRGWIGFIDKLAGEQTLNDIVTMRRILAEMGAQMDTSKASHAV